jgi:hypothetical protein
MQNLPTPQNPEAATEEEACRQLLPVEMQNPEVAVEEERRRQQQTVVITQQPTRSTDNIIIVGDLYGDSCWFCCHVDHHHHHYHDVGQDGDCFLCRMYLQLRLQFLY